MLSTFPQFNKKIDSLTYNEIYAYESVHGTIVILHPK